jgi:hypothetical protein
MVNMNIFVTLRDPTSGEREDILMNFEHPEMLE